MVRVSVGDNHVAKVKKHSIHMEVGGKVYEELCGEAPSLYDWCFTIDRIPTEHYPELLRLLKHFDPHRMWDGGVLEGGGNYLTVVDAEGIIIWRDGYTSVWYPIQPYRTGLIGFLQGETVRNDKGGQIARTAVAAWLKTYGLKAGK